MANAAAMFERCCAHQKGAYSGDVPIELLSRGYEAVPWSAECLPKSDTGRDDVVPIDEAIP